MAGIYEYPLYNLNMKKLIILLVIIVGIGSLVGYVIYDGKFSKEAAIGEKNIDNVVRLKLGMDTTTVIRIMGKPIERREFKSEIFYDYEVQPGSSFQCQLIFNSSGQVIYISPIPDNQ